MSSYRPLADGWKVAPVAAHPEVPAGIPAEVPAIVPGSVHTDLRAAGLIPDPYLDDNELQLAWIGRTDWQYRTTVDWQPEVPGGQVDLVCDGLDTVATVEVNGQLVGRSANMHRSYRFAVTELLQPGENTVAVRFDSAYRYAEDMRDRLGDRPGAYHPQPFAFIRKNACNFGWDWGPTLVTAGIWRPVGLHTWHTARLGTVRPSVTVDGPEGRVDLAVEVVREPGTDDVPVVLTAEVADVRGHITLAPGQRHASLTLVVPEPARWWPRGYGEPARYELAVQLHSGDGTELDRWQRRIGFRSVRLDTTADAHGTPFTLVVNGVPVFARGVNWIPDDVFVAGVDRQRYDTRLDQACAMNVNTIRVWGGGIYESDDFYDACDERGLLVMQDFLFACAAYPEEQPLYDEVAAEARENVVRLASHPSLVLWHGNNENIWGWHDWDWQGPLRGRTWGAGFYFDLLPKIVAELDPTRPYWPGSPYSGTPHQHPNEPSHGSMHIWDVWNQVDYTHYRSYTPRFVAEFGWQGPPAYATLRRAVADQPLAVDSPGVRHHQKADDGDGKLSRGLATHFRKPESFDDWHWLTQLNQARAMSLGVEHLRSLRPVCMGAVVWQLNDCWPVTSWAAVDGDGRRKPLWYALRRSFADRLLTIQPRGDGLALVAVNDSTVEWSAPATITRFGLDGRELARTEAALAVRAGAAATVELPAELATAGNAGAELLLAEAGGLRAWWFFAYDKDLAYPAPAYDSQVATVPGGVRVTVTARTLLRDLALFPDRLDPTAEVDEALVTLLPGESTTFTVTAAATLDPDTLTSAPVLRCANDVAA